MDSKTAISEKRLEMRAPLRFLLLALLPFMLLLASPLRGQNVGGGLSLSGVASQIDGDSYGGFEKLGINFGGWAYYDFTERISLMVEILYGHRGSREVVTATGQISLNYIDVPVMLRYKFLDNGFSRLYGEAGLSSNILLSASAGFNPFKTETTDVFRRYNMEVHGGVSYFINPNFGIFIRYSNGITNLSKIYPPWLGIYYISAGLKVGFK